ncbi:hypothetical protein PIB30_015675 [Stylosanthes scabra]|uniref:Uncharacterized protein n=1 Tax=Stylosanthes scabra TaxID=79078 RepID=A0ABU6U629_9FABA|nr:hypothetical protein [Stylosanthes scabra]
MAIHLIRCTHQGGIWSFISSLFNVGIIQQSLTRMRVKPSSLSLKTRRYKVEVMACDSTGCITLLLWEREVKMLRGKSSEKLKGEVVEGDNDYPPSLNKLLEKKLLIKIHVQSSSIIDSDPVYPVIKIVEDGELIEKFNLVNNNVHHQDDADDAERV